MTETIHILPWRDPILDTLGHDPRSLYVETFWLPTLGPTALLLLRRLAARFERQPDGYALPLAETSRCLGLGEREGRNSPLVRSLGRLVQFDLACSDGDTAVAVRRRVPPVHQRHVRRLPQSLQEQHDEWVKARLAEPALAAVRRNARRMAVVLLGMGGSADDAEQALVAAGFTPALGRESADWAWERLQEEDETPRVRVQVA